MMKIDKKLILASKSPRRYELLSPYFSSTEVVTTDVEETFTSCVPSEIVEELAKKKMSDLGKRYFDDIVVAGDTIVWYNNKLYGKPKNDKEAFEMLKELSSNTHQVYSGFAISYKGQLKCGYDVSNVKFKNLSDKQILDYIATGSPKDKAGAYGIQDGVVVESFDGDINNIIGIPVKKIIDICKEIVDE